MSDSEDSYDASETAENEVNDDEVEDVPAKRRKIIDDDENESNSEDEEEEEERSTHPQASNRGRHSDEKEEKNSEDDDEEDDEVEHRYKKKKKRNKRRITARDFIQDDVEVDDDDDEEADYEVNGDEGDFGIDPNERAEADRYLREQEKQREHRRNKYAEMTEEEMERYFQERHAAQLSTHRGGDLDDDAYDDITQNGLLPSTKDPNLWTVKCIRLGEEKIIALQLMRKFIAYKHSENPLQIKSVIVKEGIKGILYIEAYKKSHVLTAIEGISALNGYNVAMVPIKEMVDTLKVVKDIPMLKPGSYVRIKRAMYKDDLAQVDWVDIAQNRVNLKLVPRVDYTRMRGALRTQEDRVFKNKRRPQPRLFDVEKIKQIGGEVTNDGDFIIFEGGHYRRGFLYKSFPMNAVIADGVKPSLTELERFQESTDDLRKELESTVHKEKHFTFAPGDNIEVMEGELVNLRGKVVSVDGDKVVIMPDHEDLTESLTLNASEIRKYFKEGDHVRVINGRYEGDTGLVLKVEENLVILLSDLTRDELQVLPKDVQLCADVATGVDSIGQYQYQDLVMLDQDTVGVIVRLEREHVEVLTMHGKIIRIKPQSILSKKNSRFAKAMDANKHLLQKGDLVRVIDGLHANKREIDDERQGEIKHIYRTWVFLFSRKHTMNGGIFVCKARNLTFFGAVRNGSSFHSNRNTVNADLLRSPNPLASPNPAGTPHSVSCRSLTDASARETPLNMFGGVPAVQRDRSLIGKSVTITCGPEKGLTGIVKDATDSSVRIELHTKPVTKNIDRSKIRVVDGGVSVGRGPSGFMYGSFTPASHSARTPSLTGAQTPMYGAGAQTPMYDLGARTPMYGAGAQTPMHDHGRRTPHYGSMTPAYDGGAGLRTPSHGSSWDPNVLNTPAHSSSHMDEFDEGDNNFATSGFENGSFSQTPSSMPGQTPTGSVVSGMYSDYAAASPYPRSNSHSIAASPFAATPGPTTIPDQYLKNGEWCTSQIVVHLRPNYPDYDLYKSDGYVRSVMNGKCYVYFDDEDDEHEIPFEYLLPRHPSQGDQAKIVYGAAKNTVGTVVSVDGQEAVLRISGDDMRPYPLALMCKLY